MQIGRLSVNQINNCKAYTTKVSCVACMYLSMLRPGCKISQAGLLYACMFTLLIMNSEREWLSKETPAKQSELETLRIWREKEYYSNNSSDSKKKKKKSIVGNVQCGDM